MINITPTNPQTLFHRPSHGAAVLTQMVGEAIRNRDPDGPILTGPTAARQTRQVR
jgi:hypothetical protein